MMRRLRGWATAHTQTWAVESLPVCLPMLGWGGLADDSRSGLTSCTG